MKLLNAHQILIKLQKPVFHTRDAAAALKLTIAHTSKILSRLNKQQVICRLKRGCWAISLDVDRLAVPEILTEPELSYISLHTALYYHGMISQIPSVTYAASLARTQRVDTPLGTFSLHHIHPQFFFGYECKGQQGILVATPEKALLDTLYLSPGKTRLFHKLTELEIPKDFDWQLTDEWIERIPSKRTKTVVINKLKQYR